MIEMPIISLADLIMRCNNFVLNHLYPPPHVLVLGSEKHRDLVRTFFAGCLETLNITGDQVNIEIVTGLVVEINQPGWIPDKRFFVTQWDVQELLNG